MSSISKMISKAARTPAKLRDLSPLQSILVKNLICAKYTKLHIAARLEADKDFDFDRNCDTTDEACELEISDAPKSKRAEFSDAFGDSLFIDTDSLTVDLDHKWDEKNKRSDGVTIKEFEKGVCINRSFIEHADEANEADEADEEAGEAKGEEEMVAVPYACGKGVVMHAWVPKKVAGDMMGH